MSRPSRFYAFTMLFVKLLIVYIALGFLRSIGTEYLTQFEDYILPVYWIITFVRTVFIIGMIVILLYFVYASYMYLTSRFYKESQIPLHEAFFHGYFDLAYVYGRLKQYGNENDYDTKTKSVIIKFDHSIYYIIVRDIFGKLQGEAKNDTWYIVSRPKKEYGNVRYKKRRPIKNPIYENRQHIARIPKEEGVEMKNYVCITGLRRNTFENDQINTVYELEAILKQEF